jgi:hypothetical protein
MPSWAMVAVMVVTYSDRELVGCCFGLGKLEDLSFLEYYFVRRAYVIREIEKSVRL